MSKFDGRETELLEKMMARYREGCKDESKSVASTAEAAELPTPSSDGRHRSRQDKTLERQSVESTVEATESTTSSGDGRPRSRQDKALERHMAHMLLFCGTPPLLRCPSKHTPFPM